MLEKANSDHHHQQPQTRPSTSSKSSSSSDRLKVAIRIRPPLPRETEPNLPFRSIALVSKSSQTLSLVEYLGCEYEESERQREWVECPNYFQYHRFTFDTIFDMDATQDQVYEITALPAVESILQGYNSTILAYGQTGTGKTYTMEGFTYDYFDPARGIIPRTIEDIFHYIEENSNSNTTFIIRATYLQIYNESISDLLRPEKKNLSIREDRKRGLYVESLSEWAVRSPNDIYALLERGASCRAKANTNMNDVSSRSHAVFSIQVEQMIGSGDSNEIGKKHIKVGKLNLVDLAGSERIKVTGATGKQLEESKKINKSLSALGNVIYALTDTKGRTHIPYRDSKLTRLLENSLGGNCKTTMIAMISPAQCSFSESLSTLNFAKRAKTLKTKATINEDIDHNTLIRQYENELRKLRNELEEKERLLKDNNVIHELEEKKKEAERDKDEAIQALEEASIKYLQERDEKKQLEAKIQIMNFQMIPGGQKINIEETPQFQTLLQKHQILLEQDFNEKLNEIEKEREALQASKEQEGSCYKLLYKQRDIMTGLTLSLNERDESIAQLQEEIDAYERVRTEQENIIEIYKKRVNMLESILNKNNIAFPPQEETNMKTPLARTVINLNMSTSTNNSMIAPSSGTRKKNNDGSTNRTTAMKMYPKYDANGNSNSGSGSSNVGNHFHSFTNENLGVNMNIMLTPEEKIEELTNVIKDKDNQMNIMKMKYERLSSNVGSGSSGNSSNSGKDKEKMILHKLGEMKEKYAGNEEIKEDLNDVMKVINRKGTGIIKGDAMGNTERHNKSVCGNSGSGSNNNGNSNSGGGGMSHRENSIKNITIQVIKQPTTQVQGHDKNTQ